MINKDTIMSFKVREEAREYLNQFTVKELKQFADREKIYVVGNKQKTIDNIIERMIGLSIAMNAIKKLDLSVKSRIRY